MIAQTNIQQQQQIHNRGHHTVLCRLKITQERNQRKIEHRIRFGKHLEGISERFVPTSGMLLKYFHFQARPWRNFDT